MKLGTLKKILSHLENTASKDETRILFCTARIVLVNDNIYLESTDGHILARHKIENEDNLLNLLKNREFNDVLIDRDMIPQLKAFIKLHGKRTDNIDIPESIGDKYLKLVSPLGEVSLSLIAREYPKTSGILAYDTGHNVVADKSKMVIRIDAELLLKLAKALNSDNTKKSEKNQVVMYIQDGRAPIVVKSSEFNNLGVIMPCKL